MGRPSVCLICRLVHSMESNSPFRTLRLHGDTHRQGIAIHYVCKCLGTVHDSIGARNTANLHTCNIIQCICM